MSSDAHTPAQRADAVLRAAEAAAAAAQAAAATAKAASLPEPAPPPVEEPAGPVVAVEPGPLLEPEPDPPAEPPIHEAGAAGRLLAAVGDLEAHVAQARAQLDALEDALARLERYDPPAE